MDRLWEGGLKSHHGTHYTVEGARLYDLPDQPVPIAVAGSGSKSVALAGRVGDAFIGLAPDAEVLARFDDAGGAGKPRYAEVNVCWAADEEQARRTVYEQWPVAGVAGRLMQELPLPTHFQGAAEMIDAGDAAENVPHGPDPQRHLEGIQRFVDAGFDHIWIHQIGPDQEGFFHFYKDSILPKLR